MRAIYSAIVIVVFASSASAQLEGKCGSPKLGSKGLKVKTISERALPKELVQQLQSLPTAKDIKEKQ